MNCSSCGHELREGDRFCPSCGATVAKASAVEPVPSSNDEAASPIGSQSKQQSKTPYLIAFLLTVSLVTESWWGGISGPPAVKVGATIGVVMAPMLISLSIAIIINASAKIFLNKPFRDGFSASFLAIWSILIIILLLGDYRDYRARVHERETKIKALSNTHAEAVKLKAYVNREGVQTFSPQSSSTSGIPPFSAGDIDYETAKSMQQLLVEMQNFATSEKSKLDIIRQKENSIDLKNIFDPMLISTPTGIAAARTKIDQERQLVKLEGNIDRGLIDKMHGMINNLPEGDFKTAAEKRSPYSQERYLKIINDYINTRLQILETLQQIVDIYDETMGNNQISDQSVYFEQPYRDKYEKLGNELGLELAHLKEVDAVLAESRQQVSSWLSSVEQSTRKYSTSH